MRGQDWLKLAGIATGSLLASKVVSSFLPAHFTPLYAPQMYGDEAEPFRAANYPEIEVDFLRCGRASMPEALGIRGGSLVSSMEVAHSAVLIRHPQATFLYDTGLCSSISSYLASMPWVFRGTLARMRFEQSIADHFHQRHLQPDDLDFILLSHLHWDHVAGLPDLPGVDLRVNSIEYEWFQLTQTRNRRLYHLVCRLLSDHMLTPFDCVGPAYEGFRSSHDLFGDGSIILVPLPGHTPGNLGMFINRSNGSRLFLLGDACWFSQHYHRPATMYPLLWSFVTSDDASARQTLRQLHYFARQHPEVALIGMHDALQQTRWMGIEKRAFSSAHKKY